MTTSIEKLKKEKQKKAKVPSALRKLYTITEISHLRHL